MSYFETDPRQLALDGFVPPPAICVQASVTKKARNYPKQRQSVKSPLTPELLRTWVDAYRIAHNGQFPTNHSGPIPDSDTNWTAVNSAMYGGNRGWTTACSLVAWLKQHYTDYPKKEESERLSPEILRKWTDAYRLTHQGRFPTVHSGAIPGTKTNWNAVHAAMSKGHSGWSSRTTLATWLEDQYSDYPRKMNTEKLTSETLRKWTDAYRQENAGNFPQSTSGLIPGTSSDWKSVAKAMSEGSRGWDQKISLPDWLDQEYFETRSVNRMRLLTPSQVRTWVIEFRNANDGRFPSSGSGRIIGTKWTWKLLDNALSQSRCGWAEKTSLAKWLATEFQDYRSNRGKGNLNPSLIKKWATQYIATHGGRLPSQGSGAIPGTDVTWRNIDDAMRYGFRGWEEKTSLSVWLRRELRQNNS